MKLFAQVGFNECPKNGFISFKKENVVADSLLLQESTNSFIQTIISEVKGKKDSLLQSDEEIRSMELFMKDIIGIEQGNSEWKQPKLINVLYKDSIVKQYETDAIDGNIKLIKNDAQINNVLNPVDTIETRLPSVSSHYLNSDVRFLLEFPNDTLTIKGYNCFKVEMLLHSEISNSDSKLSEVYWKMYVTKDIECCYHPIIKHDTILQKYYPLQMVKIEKATEGMEEQYTIQDIDLK